MIKFFKNLYRRKRILEVGGVFIPQFLGFLNWKGIDRDNANDSWNDIGYQISNCGQPTLQAAQEQLYKYVNARKKPKKVVHELQPEVWVALKKNHE